MLLLMNLRKYIYAYPRGKRIKARQIIADALGVTEAAVRSWENGTRNPTPENAFLVETLTEGKVTKQDLRPDIYGDLK